MNTELIKDVVIVVGMPVLRSAIGWAESAVKDKTITRFEWRQLATTVTRVGTVGLGVMSSTVGTVGGSVAASGQTGLGNVAAFIPVTGTVVGSGLAIGALGKLQKAVPKRKRRR